MLETAQRAEPEISAGDLRKVHATNPRGRKHSGYSKKKIGPVLARQVNEDVFSGGETRVERADGNARAVRDIDYGYVFELFLAQQGNRCLDEVVEYVLRSLLFRSGDDS